MRSFVPLILLSSLAGCTDQLSEGDTVQSVVIHNRLSVNRLSVNHLSANHLASDKLSTNRLSNHSYELNAATAGDLLATTDGRDVLTYIVSCALPTGTTVVAPDGTDFFGELGFAPSWLDHSLSADGQGWVSACLFARVNAHDVSVPISMRGDNPVLATTPDERANWTLQEGAFYGQYFTPAADPIEWIACRGADNAGAQLADRDCAAPDPGNPGLTLCGFTYAGNCGSFAGGSHTMACKHFAATTPNGHHGYYEDCSDHAAYGVHGDDIFNENHGNHASVDNHGHGDDDHGDDDDHDNGHHDSHSLVFQQVITTFVAASPQSQAP